MKEFFIEIENPFFGTIKSEVFKGDEERFEMFKQNILDNGLSKLDFYTDNGDFIIISGKIVEESLVYIKMVS